MAGRGRHDQQQRVPGLLSDGSVPVDERHEEGEDQQVGGALLSRRRPEQHLQNHRLPCHGHTDLSEILHTIQIQLRLLILIRIVLNMFDFKKEKGQK